MDKRTRELRKLAARYDRKVVQTRRGHSRLVCKYGRRPFITVSISPSDKRAMLNIEAELKRLDKS